MKPVCQPTSKEQVLAQRQAKRAAKHKVQDSARQIIETPPTTANPPIIDSVKPKSANSVVSTPPAAATEPTKSREDIMAERELKKKAKLAAKQKQSEPVAATAVVVGEIKSANVIVPAVILPAKVVLSKSERRAKQESQRLAKSESMPNKPAPKTAKEATAKSGVDTKTIATVGLPYSCN